MLRALIEPRQELARACGHIGGFVILARKGFHGLPRVEPHDGDELHLAPERAAEQPYAAVTLDALRRDTGEDLRLEESLVGVRIVRRRPAVPDAGDHLAPFTVRSWPRGHRTPRS